jgi:hypothetical protein
MSRRVTFDINHRATMRRPLCKAAGMNGSSTRRAAYGKSSADIVDEVAVRPPNRLRGVQDADERELADLADNRSPTFCETRSPTARRPHAFDLVVNDLSMRRDVRPHCDGHDGTPWRPIVHILDICAASSRADALADAVHRQCSTPDRQNFQIREIARASGGVLTARSPSAERPDQRSYRVSFDKAPMQLPGFACEWDLRGRRATQGAVQQTAFTRPTTSTALHCIKQLRHLLTEGHIDPEFWKQPILGPNPGGQSGCPWSLAVPLVGAANRAGVPTQTAHVYLLRRGDVIARTAAAD